MMQENTFWQDKGMARTGDGKPRSDRRQRGILLSKRVNLVEFKNFEDNARKSGFDNHQEYLTAFVTGGIYLQRTQRLELQEFFGKLGKLGNNINQIARSANGGKLALNAEEIVTLHETRELLEAIRADLHRLGW